MEPLFRVEASPETRLFWEELLKIRIEEFRF
jgi:hypothetical protein